MASTAEPATQVGPGCTGMNVVVPSVSIHSGMLPLSTSGASIVDSAGNAWQITGTALGGFESSLQLAGTWNFPYRTIIVSGTTYTGIIDRLAQAGFNCIRILICEDACYAGAKPLVYVNPNFNSDWFADPTDLSTVLDTVLILDKIVAYCGSLGLRVLFDMHALAPDGNNQTATAGLWYTTATPNAPSSPFTHTASDRRNEPDWIDAWASIAQRYVNNPIVIGGDLVNEPWAATWGDDNANTDICAAYTRCANAIQAVNPNWLIFCEGIYEVLNFGPIDGGYVGIPWAAGLDRVATSPVSPGIPNQVVYSPHEYGPGIGNWNYLNAASYPDDMPTVWDTMWGYLVRENIAPVYIGEIGDMLVSGANSGRETPAIYQKALSWIATFMAYCAQQGGGSKFSWSWFCWSTNGYSGTPGSIANTNLLMGDYNTLNTNLMQYVTPNLAPLMLANIAAQVAFVLNEAGPGPATIAYATADNTAFAGTHYVASSGTVSFAAGQTTASVTVMIKPVTRASGSQLSFFLLLSQPNGCSLQRSRIRVTIGYV